MSKFCFIKQIDFTRPHADQGCCSDALPLLISSLSKRQVREGLHWGLPLQQQRHVQPHRWLLPVRSRLDRRGLLSGYALSLYPLFNQFFVSCNLLFVWPLSFTLIGINRFHDPAHPRTDSLLKWLLLYIMSFDLQHYWPKIIRRALSHHAIGNWCVSFLLP